MYSRFTHFLLSAAVYGISAALIGLLIALGGAIFQHTPEAVTPMNVAIFSFAALTLFYLLGAYAKRRAQAEALEARAQASAHAKEFVGGLLDVVATAFNQEDDGEDEVPRRTHGEISGFEIVSEGSDDVDGESDHP